MTAPDGFSSETEFTLVEVDVEDGGPEEWPTVGITLSPIYSDDAASERRIQVSMDEARLIIAGLATVLR